MCGRAMTIITRDKGDIVQNSEGLFVGSMFVGSNVSFTPRF